MASQRRSNGVSRRRKTPQEMNDDEEALIKRKPSGGSETSLCLWGCVFVGLSVIGILCLVVKHMTTPSTPRPMIREGIEPKQCSIYTAPTSLIGVPSMGIFTTRRIHKRHSILSSSPSDGPTITIFGSGAGRSKLFPNHNWLKLWGNYAWGRRHGVPEHVSYEAKTLMDYQIGSGALPNHHCLLSSIWYRFPDPPFDDSMSNHRQNPGTGAYSYNMGRDFFVKREVEAGEELFLNYGHCHRNQEHLPAWTKSVPMLEDYENAADFIMQKLNETADPRVTLTPPPGMNEFAAKLLPKTLNSKLRSLSSSEFGKHDIMVALARRSSVEKRTPEWIRENGKCLEHLIAGKSQIPDAGHGGFAQHFIAKGDVVVPSPMMHVMDTKLLAMYNDVGHKVGQQLLINYCLGHPESTFLLCPNTNAILINHCSTRIKQKGCLAPNAEYQWSPGWDQTSDEWMGMTLDEIASQPYRGLHMDVVALRDIQPGEEVFVDYGIDWEKAWQAHVAAWQPPERISISAKEANELNLPPDFLVTGDLREKPRHEHIFAGCQYWKSEEDVKELWNVPDPDWKDRGDKDLLETYGGDGSRFVGKYRFHKDLSYWPCVIIRPEDTDSIHSNSNTYLVRILQHPYQDEQSWAKNRLPRFLANYPRKSIRFFVKERDGDDFLPGVFRHPIAMPVGMFPEQWKNLSS